jgi:signal transduction histidine kinase
MLEHDVVEGLKDALATARARATGLCQFVFANNAAYRSLAELYNALAKAERMLDALNPPAMHRASPGPIQLDDFVSLQEAEVRQQMDASTTLRLDLDANDGIVQADGDELRAILRTLIDNLRSTMRNGGLLTISTGWVGKMAVQPRADPPATRRYVRLSISDVREPSAADQVVFIPINSSAELGVPDGFICSKVRALGGWTVVERSKSGSRIHVCLPASPRA